MCSQPFSILLLFLLGFLQTLYAGRYREANVNSLGFTVERIDEEDIASVNLDFSVNPNEATSPFVHSFTASLGFRCPDGATIFPAGSSQRITNRNLTILDNASGLRTYAATWSFNLGPDVPTQVDLQPIVKVVDITKIEVLRGPQGALYGRQANGVLNEFRRKSRIISSPATVALAQGFGRVDLELAVANGWVQPGTNSISITGTGVVDQLRQELLEGSELEQNWRAACEVFGIRGGPTARDFLVNFLFADGTLHELPVSIGMEGDFASIEGGGVGLVDPIIRSTAQDSQVLDLQPWDGRDAVSPIYVQFGLDGDLPFDPSTIFVNLVHPNLLDGANIPAIQAENLVGDDLYSGLFTARLNVLNDFDWGQLDVGENASLQVSGLYLDGEFFDLKLGELGFYQDLQGGGSFDTEPPGMPTNVVINGGNLVSPSGFGQSFDWNVTANLTDNLSGVESVRFFYKGPEDEEIFFNFTDAARIESDDLLENYELSYLTDRFIASGPYYFQWVEARDKSGNVRRYLEDEVDETVQKVFEVFSSVSDIVFPTLTGAITASDTSVDASNGLVPVTVSIPTADEGSVVNFGVATFYHVEKPWLTKTRAFSDQQLVADGTYEVSFTFDPSDRPGPWNLRLSLADLGENLSHYGQTDPEDPRPTQRFPEGSTETVNLVNTNWDFAGPSPELVSLLREFNDGETDPDIVLEARITSPVGFKGGKFSLTPPAGEKLEIPFGVDSRIDGNENDGLFRVGINFDPWSIRGDWILDTELEDEQGGISTYGVSNFDPQCPGDFGGIIPNRSEGSADISPPRIVPGTLTTNVGAISTGEETTLRVRFTIEDVGSGFSSGQIIVKNGLVSELLGRPQLAGKFASSPELGGKEGTGDRFRAEYEFEFQVDGQLLKGDFVSFCFILEDEAGNVVRYNSSLKNTTQTERPAPGAARLTIGNFLSAEEIQAYLRGDNSPIPPEQRTEQNTALTFDFDFDGWTNGQEVKFGTDPADSRSFFRSWIKWDPLTEAVKVRFSPFREDYNYSLFTSYKDSSDAPFATIRTDLRADPVEGETNVGEFDAGYQFYSEGVRSSFYQAESFGTAISPWAF